MQNGNNNSTFLVQLCRSNEQVHLDADTVLAHEHLYMIAAVISVICGCDAWSHCSHPEAMEGGTPNTEDGRAEIRKLYSFNIIYLQIL